MQRFFNSLYWELSFDINIYPKKKTASASPFDRVIGTQFSITSYLFIYLIKLNTHTKHSYWTSFLYSVILTEYVAIETEGVCMSVCVYVCASVCVCGSSTAKTVVSILMKLCTNDLTDIYLCHFFRFLKIQIWWRHGGHFAFLRSGTLTVAIFVRFSSNLNTSYKVVVHSLLLKISKIGW